MLYLAQCLEHSKQLVSVSCCYLCTFLSHLLYPSAQPSLFYHIRVYLFMCSYRTPCLSSMALIII